MLVGGEFFSLQNICGKFNLNGMLRTVDTHNRKIAAQSHKIKRLHIIISASLFKILSKLMSVGKRRKNKHSNFFQSNYIRKKNKLRSNVILGNDQLDTQLFYFTIGVLRSCTCFEDYMLIIKRLNFIDASIASIISI